ncbi:MAG: hypothetical protein KJ672_02030 [Candidatus Thermoplasmatota archaeon]|nr:hypothetical protein [Candidatus Thermoplasmatota archaeon]
MTLKLGKLECILCVLIAAAIILPAGVMGVSPGKKASSEKEWTLLMYWDADNSLEFCTEFAMTTWEKALTSNTNVNIVVFIDILSEDGIWIYDIEGGARKLVATWPEMNSSAPTTLEKFVAYGMSKFPAKKTMLVLQDHGYGWRGICQDETNGDVLMPTDGIGKALENAKAANRGKGVDILAFDACNMLTMETVYELRNAASYIIGSETMVPFDGLPYDMFVTELVKAPGTSARQLAMDITYQYVEYYSSKWDYDHIMRYSQDFATFAAVDTSKVAALGAAFSDLTDALLDIIPSHRSEVAAARGYALIGTWTNMAGYEWMPDMYAFVDGLKAINDPVLDARIAVFESAFDAAVIAQDNSKKYHESVHGLNFWFPPSLAQYNSQGWIWARQFVYCDVGLDIVSESSWAECLMAYYSA